MALSEYEKQVLEQMEAQLGKDDQEFVSYLKAENLPNGSSPKTGGRMSPRRIAVGAGLAIVGLITIVIGVAQGFSIWSILIGVIGFCIVLFGVLYAMKGTHSYGSSSSLNSSFSPGSPKGRKGASGLKMRWKSFLDDQERRWGEH